MSYRITARIYQTNPDNFFELVEKACLIGCKWSIVNDELVLDMISSGTSGMLRFASKNGETFAIALGVHNYARWCDVIPNLTRECCVTLNMLYYTGNRAYIRERQSPCAAVVNCKGRRISVSYTKTTGTDLRCDIVIG